MLKDIKYYNKECKKMFMKTNGFEKKILEKMVQSLVVNRSELYAVTAAKNKKERTAVEYALKELVDKGLITPVYSSHTTFAITQTGIRAAKKQFL